MNSMNEDHFFDLAMKSIAGQATDLEIKELESLISANPSLKAELDRLRADVQLAKEAMPLVDAMQAKGAQLPGYARQRLQSKVKRTLAGRDEQKSIDDEAKGIAWGWRWFLGLAAAAAVVVLVIVPLLSTAHNTQIQVAFLDLAGTTRGADTNNLGLFVEKWKGATVTNISSLNDLKSWEQVWPANARGYEVKVVYDRAAAEIRVVGKGRGREFTNSFSVAQDPLRTLDQVQAYIRQEATK
jgi:hypothetical protein